MENSTGNNLFEAIKRNDEEALKSFYVKNYAAVESYILVNKGTRDDAKDVYQEAFIAMWRNIQLDKFFPLNEDSLAGYLYRIARNKWTDHLRTMYFKKTTPLNDSVTPPVMEDMVKEEDMEYIQQVKEKFSGLGDHCRELLSRYYYKKESLRVIAERFKWTEATAKNNKYRCMQRLRDLLKK